MAPNFTLLFCLVFVRKIFLIYFLFIFPHTRLSRLSTNLHFVIYRENNLYPWVSTSYIITGIQSRYTHTGRIIYLSYYLHSRTHYECANSVSDKMSANYDTWHAILKFWALYNIMLNENIFRTSSSSQRKNPCHLRPCRL